MKIAIIEDEKITAKDLARTILQVSPDAEIVVQLHSVEDAIAYFSKPYTIDLIFSDIQLGDGLSFEVFERCHHPAPVIFCTAFNQYALEAFHTVGIDYLIKPFNKATVEKALNKFLQLKSRFGEKKSHLPDLMELLKQQLKPSRLPAILLHQGDKIVPLPGEQIALFYMENDYAFAYTFDQKKHILPHKMDDLENRYALDFFRANRQFLVNRKAIQNAAQYFNRKLLIQLNIPFSQEILVGKLKVTSFLNWLANP